tara:strand:+ start:309 stop:989 length:681 start_codon:yes stop_codon:yes gene_type:complete
MPDNKEEINLDKDAQKKPNDENELNFTDNINNNDENDEQEEQIETQEENEENIEDKKDASDKNQNKNLDMEEEISILREEKLRLLADMENLRKRSNRENIESIKYGSINLAREMLSTGDNLARALENLPDEKDRSEPIENLIDGLKMVQKEFFTILEKNGVKKIESLNTKFDHNFHQSILEIERNDCEAGTVVKEIQAGYMMHDRLLRPSMVGVSKKNNKKVKESE